MTGFREEWESASAAMASHKDGMSDVVETRLIVRPNPPTFRGRTYPVTHSLAHVEREQPDTFFVAVIEDKIFRQQGAAADAAQDKSEAKLRQCIRDWVARHSTETTQRGGVYNS